MSTPTLVVRDADLLDTAAAALIGVRPQTLILWRSAGRYALRYVKAGRKVYYRRHDVLDWLERRSATSVAQLAAATA